MQALYTARPSTPSLASLLWDLDPVRDAHPAVIEEGRETSYGELRERAAAFSGSLRAAGIEPGDRVGILLPRGADAMAAIFAAAAAGAVTVSISDRLRSRQVEYILEHSGASAIISSRDMLARLPRPLETTARFLLTDEALHGEPADPVIRSPGDPAQIIYTSGSTGMPKGVVHGHGSLGAGIDAVIDYLGLSADDRVASLLPFSSVYGLNQLLCSVALGSTLLVDHSPIANDVAAKLAAQGVSVLAAVPPLWLQLLRAPTFTSQPITSLRVLQNAGGHLPVPAVRELRQAHPQASLFLMYGQTETFRGSYLPAHLVDERPGSIGVPMPGSQIHVVRDDLTPCDAGEVGELVQRGPAIALGYWNDGAATDRIFRPAASVAADAAPEERAVFTGDLVRRDEHGFLHFVSRKDHLIKTLGFRVGPDEILDVLHASGEIREGVITTEPDRVRGEQIVANVVLTESGDLKRLTRFARIELPPHMVPARYVVHESLPRMAGGKYDMKALRALLAPQSPQTAP